jgi:hypothetical protein
MHQNTTGLNLSPELRALLINEMQHVKQGMESLVLAVVSANWQVIEAVGHKIKSSYIMEAKLTKQQKHELHEKLPGHFKELDGKFHYYSGMLSHAAKEKDMELVNFYIYKMNETCVACHSRFVADRFAGFKLKNQHQMHQH